MRFTYRSPTVRPIPMRLAALVIASALTCAGAASAAALAQSAPSDQLAAILGTDANNDGVRDDVEPFLKSNFGKDERMLRSVTNMVISVRYALKATTTAESSQAHSMSIRSQECLMSLGEALLPFKGAFENLQSMLLDTPARMQAFERHAARIADMDFAVRNAPEWEEWCSKPIDEK